MTPPSEDAAPIETEAAAPEAGRSWLTLFGVAVRVLARVWIVAFLLFGAALVGIAATQVWQMQGELRQLRAAPGPDAYAIVAYRRELERQIEAYRRDWRSEAVPLPPARPRLLEEIDLARLRNREPVANQGRAPNAVSAPQ